jgi:hypothetical protein
MSNPVGSYGNTYAYESKLGTVLKFSGNLREVKNNSLNSVPECYFLVNEMRCVRAYTPLAVGPLLDVSFLYNGREFYVSSGNSVEFLAWFNKLQLDL